MASILSRDSRLGKILHDISKPMIRALVDQIAKQYREIIEKKLREGFVNQEVKLLYEEFNELIEQQKPLWLGPEDKNWKMYHDLRDIICVMIDEDSYYLLRFFYFLEMLFRDQEKFRIEMHQQRSYWGYDEMRQANMEIDVLYWPPIYEELKKLREGKNAGLDG